MKQSIITVLLAVIISTPAIAEEVLDSNLTPEINNISTKQEIPFKQPASKKALAKKFLIAMGTVIASSLALYVGLTVYNNMRNKIIKTATTDYTNTLNTPDNLKDAVNIYLEKTRG